MARIKRFLCCFDFSALFVIIIFIALILTPQSIFSKNSNNVDKTSSIELTDRYKCKSASNISLKNNTNELAASMGDSIQNFVRTMRLRQIINKETGGLKSIKGIQNSTKNSYTNGSKLSSRTTERQKGRTGLSAKSAIVPLKIHLRPIAGTPRQIEAIGGKVLQNAVRGYNPGRKRDVETAKAFLRNYRGLIHISDPNSEFVEKSYQTDKLGRSHVRFTQAYRRVPVWPTEMIVHLDKQGNVDKMNGAFVSTPRKTWTKPVLSASRAISKARAAVTHGYSADIGIPELVVFAPGDSAPRTCWKMKLGISLTSQWMVLIDALTGSTLAKYPLVYDASVLGSGVDLFGTTQQINVWNQGQYYYLIDTSKPMYDSTSTPPNIDDTRGAIITIDADNQTPENLSKYYYIRSSSSTSGWLPDGVSVSYIMSKLYDYYKQELGRNSIDDKGCSIVSLVRLNWANACFSPGNNAMLFGNQGNYAGAFDIVGHEFNHGVQDWTAKLIYQDQTGAIMEAYSDYFGEMFELYATDHNDWLIGTLMSEQDRDLADPSSITIPGLGPYPEKMSEYYPKDKLNGFVNQDNGGVHINCTIPSHAFYLLAEGMSGAIGKKDAASILYRALTYHLTSNAQFIDVRLACLASAEELFGSSSNQVKKTGEAFDAVEIVDSSSTPVPQPTPPVTGSDSVLFSFYDNDTGAYFLGRREGSDPEQGVFLSKYDITSARASVSGDGEFAIFVDSVNDLCFIPTDGSSPEESLGYPGLIHSAAMTPDGNTYGFVFLNTNGEPDNSICIIDIVKKTTKTFELVSPNDAGSTKTVLSADALDFTSDGKYIVYDAFNVIKSNEGEDIGVWSIYAIDIENEQTIVLLPPVADLDIAYPALSQTSDSFITFDAYDPAAKQSTVYIGNLVTYDLSALLTVQGNYAVPSFNGDDSKLVYSDTDSTPSGFSLWTQALTSDHISPQGSPKLYVSDADFGVIYRRGVYTPVEAKISVSSNAVSFGDATVGSSATRTFTIQNIGTADLRISTIELSGSGASNFSCISNGSGQVLTPSGTCLVNIIFTPKNTGGQNANVTITSDDPHIPTLNVSITGSGASSGGSDSGEEGDSGGGGSGGGCFIITASH
jgi:bacillolysin